MALRSKAIVLGLALTIGALAIALVPQAISQESQHPGSPLKDVCREGWSRYDCGSTRVCVSPELENQYDLAASSRWSVEGCSKTPTQRILPDAWAHATPEEIGYLSPSFRWRGYWFHDRVVNLDSSIVKNRDLDGAVEQLLRHGGSYPYFMDRFNEGRAKHHAEIDDSLERYGLPPPPETGKELCPPGWSKFSCRFVRLCVSPSVSSSFDLTSSKEFGYADCKSDNRAVSGQDINFKPHDVGLAAGALVGGPVYLKAVKLDSSDIFEGDIDEAIQRLVLVPIPVSALLEYDRGHQEGEARFQKTLDKAKQLDSGRPK
jgi:hypothetical protein